MKKVKQMFNQIVQLLSEIKEAQELAACFEPMERIEDDKNLSHEKILKDIVSQLQSERERNKDLTASLDIANKECDSLRTEFYQLRSTKAILVNAIDKCHAVMMQPMAVAEQETLKLIVTGGINKWLEKREEAGKLFYYAMEKLNWTYDNGVWKFNKKHNYAFGGPVMPQQGAKHGEAVISKDLSDDKNYTPVNKWDIIPEGPKAGEGGIKEVFVVDVPSEKLRESRLLKTIEELKEENSNYEKMLKIVKNDFDSLQKKYNKLYMSAFTDPESEKVRLQEAELKVKTGSETIFRLQELNEKRAEDIVHLTKTLKTAREDFDVLENRYERLEKLKDEMANALEKCFAVMERPICVVERDQIIKLEINPFSKWDEARYEAELIYWSVMGQTKGKEKGINRIITNPQY